MRFIHDYLRVFLRVDFFCFLCFLVLPPLFRELEMLEIEGVLDIESEEVLGAENEEVLGEVIEEVLGRENDEVLGEENDEVLGMENEELDEENIGCLS